MSRKIVDIVIRYCLSKFISDFDRDKIQVSLLSGKITLENLIINPKILIEWQLPILFKYTRIVKIDILIPLLYLKTKSIEINISGIYCIAVPIARSNWNIDLNYFVDAIKINLENYENWWNLNAEKNNSGDEKGYFGNLLEIILKNLKVNLTDIHLRYEDSFNKSSFSLGLKIKSIQLLPKLRPSESNTKRSLKIEDLLFYLNEEDNHYPNPEKDIHKSFKNNRVLQRNL